MVRAGQRDRLERVCRYALRPPLARERLHLTREGEIWLALRHRWADGTTHVRFDPLEFLERLAVLTPRPRVNLILYCSVLAPRAAWRSALVPGIAAGSSPPTEVVEGVRRDASRVKAPRAGAYQWAELMRRTLGSMSWPVRAVGRLRLVALIHQTSVIQRVLRHLGLPTDVPQPRPARAPPRQLDFTDDQVARRPRIRRRLVKALGHAGRGVVSTPVAPLLPGGCSALPCRPADAEFISGSGLIRAV